MSSLSISKSQKGNSSKRFNPVDLSFCTNPIMANAYSKNSLNRHIQNRDLKFVRVEGRTMCLPDELVRERSLLQGFRRSSSGPFEAGKSISQTFPSLASDIRCREAVAGTARARTRKCLSVMYGDGEQAKYVSHPLINPTWGTETRHIMIRHNDMKRFMNSHHKYWEITPVGKYDFFTDESAVTALKMHRGTTASTIHGRMADAFPIYAPLRVRRKDLFDSETPLARPKQQKRSTKMIRSPYMLRQRYYFRRPRRS